MASQAVLPSPRQYQRETTWQAAAGKVQHVPNVELVKELTHLNESGVECNVQPKDNLLRQRMESHRLDIRVLPPSTLV